jgi:phospholipid/cholesterol/gamma-HCH transport system substrate-binding protein
VPSQQEVHWSQLKVGVLIFIAILALVALVFVMSGSGGGVFTPKYTIRTYFQNSSGLKVGGQVTLEGVTIGSVKDIRVVPDRKLTPVEVTMRVPAKFAKDIHQDSKAGLVTQGVLGDTEIDIDSEAAKGPPIADNAEIQTNESPSLTDVIKSSQGTIEQLNTILGKLNTVVDQISSGKGSVGKLINDPVLYDQAVHTVGQLEALVDQISSGKGSIGKLVNDDTMYTKINDAVTHLDAVSQQIDSGQGTVGKLLKDPTLYNNLQQSSTQLNTLLGDVNAGKGGLGLIVHDPAFAQKLNDTITRVDSILTRADNGEGTLGQLVRNPSLYDHADEAIANASHLVTAIRENPKTYLTFHVKIF